MLEIHVERMKSSLRFVSQQPADALSGLRYSQPRIEGGGNGLPQFGFRLGRTDARSAIVIGRDGGSQTRMVPVAMTQRGTQVPAKIAAQAFESRAAPCRIAFEAKRHIKRHGIAKMLLHSPPQPGGVFLVAEDPERFDNRIEPVKRIHRQS